MRSPRGGPCAAGVSGPQVLSSPGKAITWVLDEPSTNPPRPTLHRLNIQKVKGEEEKKPRV